jgi:hypothetical protein
MSIDIRPIKIMFDTNIPGKQSITFTKSLLYNPELKDTSGLDEYPYFTMDTTFPFSYLNSLSYEKRLNFFFNKSEMMKTFKIYKKELFKDAVGTDVMPEILTKDEQAVKQQIASDEKDQKERLIELKEIIPKKEKEFEKYKLEPKQNIKIVEENIEKTKNEIKKKSDEYNSDLNMLTEKSINTKRESLFKAKNPEETMESVEKASNGYAAFFFNEKIPTKAKNRTDVKTEAQDYIKNISAIIEKFEKTFKIFLNEQEHEIFKNIKKILDDKQSEKLIDNELLRLYNLIKGLPGTLTLIINIISPLINDHLSDKENEELKQLETKLAEENTKITVILQKMESELNDLKNEKSDIEAKLNKEKGSTQITINDEEIQKIERAKFQTKNGDENVLIMLRLLFPTKYPIMGNIFSSFNSVILKTSDFTLSFSDFLPSFLRKKLIEGTALYSYLKIDGKVYTVAQAVWLNDIYNHKEYADLIDKFKKLKIWKDKASRKLSDEIKVKLTKFKSNYGSGFDKSDLTYIENQKKDVSSEALRKITKDQYSLGKLQLEYNTYNGTLYDFIKTVNVFQKSVIDNDAETISDNAKNMVDTYKLLTKYGTNFFKPKDKFNRIIENVNRDLEDIRINEYIRDRYMFKPGVDLDYERDDPKYSSKLKSNFKEYTEFADNIKKFRAPNKESSNYQLQKTFNEFLENREKYKGLFNFLMNPYNININPFDNVKKKEAAVGVEEFIKEKESYHLRKNTGVTLLPSAGANEPGYEIYVQLNVIAGELNDSNKSLVDCLYQGDSLGNKLEYLVNETLRNPWDINSNRLFFDITQGEAAKEIETNKKEEDKATTDEKTSEKSEIKKGGKIIYNMNTRKLRGDIIKTRKNKLL